MDPAKLDELVRSILIGLTVEAKSSLQTSQSLGQRIHRHIQGLLKVNIDTSTRLCISSKPFDFYVDCSLFW